MKVVHIAFECAPVYKTGGLGDVVGSLPKYQMQLGVTAAVVMPGYSFIRRLHKLPHSQVPIIYAESELFTEELKSCTPRLQANAYLEFNIKALSVLKENGIRPDIIHCHDWHAGLIPGLVKHTTDSFFKDTKTVLSIHNIGYQGNFKKELFDGERGKVVHDLVNARGKRLNFLKEGIRSADFILTVSPNHAREIRERRVGFGLGRVIRAKRGRFAGILNGIDYDVWNPHTDKYLYQEYNRKTVVQGKTVNKTRLQQELGLEINNDIPLVGFVARLSTQKGIDLLAPIIPKLPRRRVQLVILGTGEKKFERTLKAYTNRRFSEWISVNLRFDETTAHRIYAACDFLLIPSHYEPCGLTQMIAVAYSALPIASAVGGLKDTIEEGRTGFLFHELNSETLLNTIERALAVWENPEQYRKMRAQALRKNFSWEKSAAEYIKIYKKLF